LPGRAFISAHGARCIIFAPDNLWALVEKRLK